MNRKTLGLARTLAGLCAALVANAYAGVYYEATTTNKTEGATKAQGATGENKTTVNVWSEGSSTKIEFKDGQQMGLFGPGSYLLTKDAGQTLYLVKPENKTYSSFDLGGMMNAAGKVMGGMSDMIKMEVTNPHFEKVSESAGGNILGHATQHVTFKSGYTMSVTVMGKKMDHVVDMKQDLWMATEIDPVAFNAWLRPDKMMTGMFKGLGDLMSAQFNQVTGAPLKSVVESSTSGGMSGPAKHLMTTEVTTLRQETIPAETFALPADYKETQLIDEVSSEGQDDQGKSATAGQDAATQGISTLKGLFGK
jgi:hypothetical protein